MQITTLSCTIVIFVMNKCAPQFLVAFSKKKKVCGELETVWYFLFLTFEWPLFVANVKKSLLEIHFIYLSRKRLRFVLQTRCIITIIFYTKCHLFHNFFFLCSNHTDFLINCALKYKYQPVHLKVVGRKSPSWDHHSALCCAVFQRQNQLTDFHEMAFESNPSLILFFLKEI